MAGTDTWTGNGDWSDGADWSNGSPPGSSVGAVFSTPANVSITSASVLLVDVASLSMTNAGVNIDVQWGLTVGGALNNMVPNFIDSSQGTLTIDDGSLTAGQYVTSATGTVHLTNGGTYQWNADGSSTQTVDMGNSDNDTFQFSTQFDGTLSNFVAGDFISYSGTGTVDSITVGDDLLTFNMAGGQDYTIKLAGDYNSSNIIVDGRSVETSATCYCPGTMILTDAGEIAIEKLAIGDKVATLHGPARAIKWIGRRSYEGRFIAGEPLMLPVCVKQGAIEENVPARDLYLSPGHALCIDGALVPAWLLVNGVSIVQATSVERVAYIHLEFEDHEVIFANSCPAESFIDDNCRNQFQNAAEYYALYPEHEAARRDNCLPRIEEGFHLQAMQRRLAARAGVKTSSDQSGPLRGFVDHAGPKVVSGWAQNELQPEAPVCLDILVDGKRLMRVLANRYRADLREAGMGSGKHSFEAQLPAGIFGRIEVRRSFDQADLALTEAAMALAA